MATGKTRTMADDGQRAEWLAERRKGIGGSDVAAVLGLSKWASPVDVWLDKTGQKADEPPTEAMYWGTVHEAMIAQEYARRTGRRVERCNQVLRHPEHPELLANVDRLVWHGGKRPRVKGELRTDRILECKTADRFAAGQWGEPGTDHIPLYYLTQCLHYLEVTGAAVCDVAVLVGGNDFRLYEVRRDPDMQARMVRQLTDWWQRHVVGMVPPPPRTREEVEALIDVTPGLEMYATEDIEEVVDELRIVRAEITQRREREKVLVDRICTDLGDADTLVNHAGEKLVTWKKSRDSLVTDWKGIAEACLADVDDDVRQMLLDKHTKTRPGSRRFLVK